MQILRHCGISKGTTGVVCIENLHMGDNSNSKHGGTINFANIPNNIKSI